jgi:sugar (pentulose or hexulose) kinase
MLTYAQSETTVSSQQHSRQAVESALQQREWVRPWQASGALNKRWRMPAATGDAYPSCTGDASAHSDHHICRHDQESVAVQMDCRLSQPHHAGNHLGKHFLASCPPLQSGHYLYTACLVLSVQTTDGGVLPACTVPCTHV